MGAAIFGLDISLVLWSWAISLSFLHHPGKLLTTTGLKYVFTSGTFIVLGPGTILVYIWVKMWSSKSFLPQTYIPELWTFLGEGGLEVRGHGAGQALSLDLLHSCPGYLVFHKAEV